MGFSVHFERYKICTTTPTSVLEERRLATVFSYQGHTLDRGAEPSPIKQSHSVLLRSMILLAAYSLYPLYQKNNIHPKYALKLNVRLSCLPKSQDNKISRLVKCACIPMHRRKRKSSRGAGQEKFWTCAPTRPCLLPEKDTSAMRIQTRKESEGRR